MSTFQADDFGDVDKALREMERRLEEVAKLTATTKGRAVQRAALLIVARAKEITTEKNHIQTGALRRSWNAQLVRESKTQVVAEVGSPLVYAKSVEALPATGRRPVRYGPRGGVYPSRGEGGGILGPAAEQTFQQVSDLIVREGFEPALERWSRPGGA